ncbi:MAG TPA: metalloregulator ArsR/SmtB family transcription factor [Caulobacteraceae bacterium]|nr:metalloregulator ArsR/SmtB family transcription factor [Caulobacteraceae bacterium]
MSARAASLDRTLAALADPIGRRAVDLLGERPHSAGELAQKLGLPAPAMSRRLAALRRSGLVEDHHPEFDARVRIYSLKAAPMRELKAWLEASERLWSAQLSAFKARVEEGS